MADLSAERYFRFDLSTPRGLETRTLLPFSGLEAACCELYTGMPDTAGDLFRQGLDALACVYLVRDEEDAILLEIGFAELLRDAPSLGSASRSDERWSMISADLQRRSDRAIVRLEGATARISRLTAQALAIAARTLHA